MSPLGLTCLRELKGICFPFCCCEHEHLLIWEEYWSTTEGRLLRGYKWPWCQTQRYNLYRRGKKADGLDRSLNMTGDCISSIKTICEPIISFKSIIKLGERILSIVRFNLPFVHNRKKTYKTKAIHWVWTNPECLQRTYPDLYCFRTFLLTLVSSLSNTDFFVGFPPFWFEAEKEESRMTKKISGWITFPRLHNSRSKPIYSKSLLLTISH